MASTDFPPEVLARVSPEILASMVKVRIPGGVTPLRLWPKQREILKALQDPEVDELWIPKARQTGVTQVITLYALSHAIRIAASHGLIVSKGDREAQEASSRVRQMYASLPHQVKRQHSIYHKNIEEFRLTHPELPEPQGALEDAITCDIRNLPAGAGRSYASDLLICDEADHWDDADRRMADIRPTLARHGKLVVASTANGFGGFLHTGILRARQNPRARVIFVSSLDRPGRTKEWVDAQRESLGHLGPQEHPLTLEEAFLSTGHGVFEPEHLNWQIENIVRQGHTYEFTPVQARASLSAPWTVWEAPGPDRRYLVAADPAGGGPHSDPSAAAVFDVDAGIQVAAFHGRPLPHILARELAAAGALYNRALLVPESNNTGQAVIAHLTNLGYGNIYMEERFSTPGQPMRKTYGYNTNQKSKQFAVDQLRTSLRERTIGIRDAEAIEECMRFTELAPGKYAARSGHDDRVMSLAIAAAVMAHSRMTSYRTPTPLSAQPTRETLDRVAGY